MYFILITCDNYSDQIEKDITKMLPKDVKHEFQSTYGVYDAVLKIEMKNQSKDNGRELASRIKSLTKIHTTLVLRVN